MCGGVSIFASREYSHAPAFYMFSLDAVDADIDDHGTSLDPIAPDQLRASRCGNDDIRRSAYVGEIHCVPVADDDRASLLQEQQGNRLAHDIGLADHDGPLAPEVGHHALKKDHAAHRRAGHEASRTRREPTDIDGMKAH